MAAAALMCWVGSSLAMVPSRRSSWFRCARSGYLGTMAGPLRDDEKHQRSTHERWATERNRVTDSECPGQLVGRAMWNLSLLATPRWWLGPRLGSLFQYSERL